jgi:hypothetical protein
MKLHVILFSFVIAVSTVFVVWAAQISKDSVPTSSDVLTVDGRITSVDGVKPLQWIAENGQVIMSCDQTVFEKDAPWKVKKVAGCKIADGHTLDEVIQGSVENMQQLQEREQTLEKSIQDYLQAEDRDYRHGIPKAKEPKI